MIIQLWRVVDDFTSDLVVIQLKKSTWHITSDPTNGINKKPGVSWVQWDAGCI